MPTVGIIANPAAGKDIRRLVAQGRFVPNREKVNTLVRILAGLEAAGVRRVVMMPDAAMLGRAAADGNSRGLHVQFLDMPIFNEERDSTRAAELMDEMSVGCLITLGGDGTNRAVVKGSARLPMVAVSTGTNNVFPSAVEGTVAGLAAGVVARGLVDLASVASPTTVLEVHVDGEKRDVALVDVAVCTEQFTGARAVWDVGSIHEVFLARAEAASIGLSSIGARLSPLSMSEGSGLHIRLGSGGISVLAPIGPGLVRPVPVSGWEPLPVGKSFEIELRPCTIALDGERTLPIAPGTSARAVLTDSGPRVVSVEAALAEATGSGVFTLLAGGEPGL